MSKKVDAHIVKGVKYFTAYIKSHPLSMFKLANFDIPRRRRQDGKNSMLELAMQINALGAVDGGSECRHCSRGLLYAPLSRSAQRASSLFPVCVCTCFIMILVRCNGISTGRQRQRGEIHCSSQPPTAHSTHSSMPPSVQYIALPAIPTPRDAGGQHICIQSMHRFMRVPRTYSR